MLSSLTPLPDIGPWARGSGLEIVLLLTGTILLTRFATWLGGRITDRIDANARETDALVRSAASKHRYALASVITWVTLVVIYCAAGVAILARFGIPVTSLVAPAAVVGVALGSVPSVPLDLVETAAGEIRLRCTHAEFDKLEHAEEPDLEEADGGGGGLVGDALAYGDGRAYAPVGPGELIDVGPQRIHRRSAYGGLPGSRRSDGHRPQKLISLC